MAEDIMAEIRYCVGIAAQRQNVSLQSKKNKAKKNSKPMI